MVSSHYQPATDLLAHSEHIYAQNHKSSIVFQLGQYTDGPLCKDLLDNQVILNHRMLPHKSMIPLLISSLALTIHLALICVCKTTVSISHIPHIEQVALHFHMLLTW